MIEEKQSVIPYIDKLLEILKEIHQYYRTRKDSSLKKMQSVIAVASICLESF